MLQGIGELSRDEQERLDAFHRNIFETIRSIHNQEYDLNMKWRYSDEVYNNQFVGHLTALLSIARLLDDEPDFDAALKGGEGARAINLPWIELFNNVIYGENDTPLLNITPNTSVDPLKNHSAYSTAIVAPGEINDRYRHANPAQTIGYPMGSLQGPLYGRGAHENCRAGRLCLAGHPQPVAGDGDGLLCVLCEIRRVCEVHHGGEFLQVS